MAMRSCRVTIQDLDGVAHTVEVTASTLYEAVAQGLAAIRGREWVAGVEQSIGLVKVSVTLPWRAGEVGGEEGWVAAGRDPAGEGAGDIGDGEMRTGRDGEVNSLHKGTKSRSLAMLGMTNRGSELKVRRPEEKSRSLGCTRDDK